MACSTSGTDPGRAQLEAAIESLREFDASGSVGDPDRRAVLLTSLADAALYSASPQSLELFAADDRCVELVWPRDARQL